jgi:hypothetical protein
METGNAEIGTSQTRGIEERYAESSSHPYSQTGTTAPSENVRTLGRRVSRAVGSGTIGWFAGKIYSRLVREAEERLAEARSCIAWYQAEEQKQLQKLEELQREIDDLESGEIE